MKKSWSLLFSVSCCALSNSLVSKPAIAQVSADGTTNTTVSGDGNGNFTIEQGDRAGNNLFHSFGDFSVPTNGSAFFNNAMDVSNIFSRVTGGNISNIDGLIQANGSANLFLINPAGILFGNNAQLDVGGSFLGTTADSILFEDGVFSATDFDNPPLLTVNAPIGLNFRDNPGDIVNTSVGQNPDGETNITGGAVGLQVPEGRTLALVGGNVLLDDGNLTAKGGHIEISSVLGDADVGIIETEKGFTFNYDSINSFGDITLQNTSVVDVNSSNGGSINVNGNNLTVSNSSLNSGIASGLGTANSQAGDIKINTSLLSIIDRGIISNSISGQGSGGKIIINANDSVALGNQNSRGFLFSDVNVDAIGNSGGIEINTGSLTATNASQITSQVFGKGNSGDININAQGKVSFDGRDETDSFPSAIFTSVEPSGEGNGGNINIQAESLEITNRAQFLSNVEGIGDGGDINIQVADEVRLVNSILISEVSAPDENDEGGRGDAGDINITTSSLLLQDGSSLLADTENIGDAGNINIEAQDGVVLEGEGFSAFTNSTNIVPSQITATADDFEGVIGEGGNINIFTSSLTVRDGGFISARTFGQGDAGNLTINTERLLLEGGQLNTITFGDGDAGNLIIRASESLEILGTSVNSGSSTGIFASAIGGTGNGGNLTIATEQLTVRDQALLSVSNFQSRNLIPPGSGAAGTLNIEASSIQLDNEGTITAANANGIGGTLTISADSLSLDNRSSIEAFSTSEIGEGGIINLNLDNNLFLRNSSEISARADNGATGGTINLNTNFIIAFPNEIPGDGSDIIASAVEGDGGNISITAESLLGISEGKAIEGNGTNDIDASSDFGLDGTISIFTPDINLIQGAIELPSNVVTPDQAVAQACSNNLRTASNFVINGKGGTPPLPDAPMNSEMITVDGTTANSSQGYAISTGIGDIIPARGVIKRPDGSIVLTATPVKGNSSRVPSGSPNCS
ncbi:MAG: filamentous hemagglutinin N-terminal domain-containing protein [Cyanobacteria bacterium P01_A01_bin.83]